MSRVLLIVDDIKINREILKNLLADSYDILEAENGQHALEIMQAEHERISAVLLDLCMPVMDGYAVLEHMRSSEALSALPVIVMTGQTDNDSEERALSLGANDYISKPYKSAIIKQRIRNTINLRERAATIFSLQRDRLTGLYSRERFFELAQELISSHEPGYYIMACFDIENFKVINDQHGTEKGDEVLRHIARVFAEGFEPLGGLCCRIAGDDFAVLYPTRFRSSTQIERIRTDASRISWLVFPLTFTIGRYVVSDLSLSASAMYDRAGLACGSIKGRYDHVIAEYDETMRSNLLTEQNIVTQMRSALAQRQFEVWFQPQYNHSTGALIGSEALVRWRHPEKGLVSPGLFIPIFEKNGFIYELDKYVWESVCAYLRKWTDEGRNPLPVSVNISRVDIFRGELVSVFKQLLTKYALPMELLRLEVTESAFSGAGDQIVDTVKALVAEGFTVEIDDFGSGYSSLNTLKSVPAQVVKLDMKFLEGDDDSERGGNIIESVVRMTQWLGMAILAEGVETVEQADFLKSIGCSYVQGYLYARPMPAEDYEAHCRGIEKEERLLSMEAVENLDRNSFWDPSSMDTLIFNSYVGGACIFEYHEGRLELLRANDKYAQTFDGCLNRENVYSIPVTDIMDEESRARLLTSIETAIATNTESSCEALCRSLSGDGDSVYILFTARVIARAGSRYLLYTTVMNTTAQRLAEQRRQELAERLEVIMADVGSGITAVTYENGHSNIIFSNDKFYDIIGFSREQFQAEVTDSFNIIHPEDVDWVRQAAMYAYTAHNPAQIEFRICCGDGTERWLRVSLSSTRFSNVDSDVQLSILEDISAEKKAELALKSTYSLLDTLMKDTPGGFLRAHIEPDGSTIPVYFNDGYLKFSGYTREELENSSDSVFLSRIHPQDTEIVRQALARAIKDGQASTGHYRFHRSDGSYIWLMSFARTTQNEAGDRFLNIYYTDATEQARVEKLQKELLDNLPCGVALYDYDGSELKIIHLNKRYWELVAREPRDEAGISVMSAIHPDDTAIIVQELPLAIAENRDCVLDLRILYGSNEYRPFHIVGRISRKNDDNYAIYATYTPISDEAMSYQEMLPIVLRATMEMQTELAFVKDRNLRYICASRAVSALLGHENPAELIGKTDFDLFDRTAAEKFGVADRRILESGEPIVDWVDIIPMKNGEERYACTSKFPLTDSKGNIIGVYGMGRDITEDRTMKSRLELLTNNIPGGIATYEYKDGILSLSYFNDGYCRLFELTREDCRISNEKNIFTGVYTNDIPKLLTQLKSLLDSNAQTDCVFRARLRSGELKWINLKAVPFCVESDKTTINAVFFDITQQQDALEKLRISEEENRLAIESSQTVVCRFSVDTRTLMTPPSVNSIFEVSPVLEDVPYSEIRQGRISPETAATYANFYESIMAGEKTGEMLFQRKSVAGWRWVRARFATIFSETGRPVSAVIAYVDETESFEKDAAYKKWRQSISAKPEETYSLYRCNINKQCFFDTSEGSLIGRNFSPTRSDFDGRTAEYAAQCVADEDAERFVAFLKADSLLSGYYQGKTNISMDYRETQLSGGYRWLRLTVDLVEYMNSSDVEAYLLFEDIDEAKRAQLYTLERAETDPLTGLMNRATFAARVDYLLETAKPNSQHALLMMDIDGFKNVNDAFGHGAGDQTLIDIAESLRSALRHGDLVGRLGGDEFVIFLADIPGDAIAAKKAQQICALTRKTFSSDVEISSSIGIATIPRDGSCFRDLYSKADAAMYHVKGSGKNNHAFYDDEMQNEERMAKSRMDSRMPPVPKKEKKRRILIVDDNRMDQAVLSNLFAEDFTVEKAKDGPTALVRMRHYGSAISVVLLDLMMPGMSGIDVLRKMQESEELRTIPVIVVSSEDNRETSLAAIRTGATDYVTKPVDAEILRIRVQSAIGKAENERLRAKNSFLEFQNSEVRRYKTVLERNGILVIEHDWVTGSFSYDPLISKYIFGNYDERNFWHILLTDFVTDTMTVKRMQELVHAMAADRQKTDETILVKLKSPSKKYHWFRMGIYKLINEHGLTGKIYLSFYDLGAEQPTAELMTLPE